MKESQKQTIILATITCIEKYGLNETTIRKIAEEANVNSAAISYYFGNRDNLIDIALSLSLQNAFDKEDFKDINTIPYKEYIKQVFVSLSKGALMYPNLTKAHISDNFMKGSTNPKLKKYMKIFFDSIIADILPKCSHFSIEEIQLRFMVLSSSTYLFYLTNPKIYDEIGQPENMENYISVLVELLFQEKK